MRPAALCSQSTSVTLIFLAAGILTSFLLSAAAYWFFKVFFLPDVMTYTPLSAWMPMIPEESFLLRPILFPLAIILVAVFTSWKATYGYKRSSSFFMLLIYMAIEGILSMAFYGVAIYGGL